MLLYLGRDELLMDGLRLEDRSERAERVVRSLFCSGHMGNFKVERKKGITLYA
jgi:N-acetylmuramoyl-L-alanine amidase